MFTEPADTLDPRHFGPKNVRPKCLDIRSQDRSGIEEGHFRPGSEMSQDTGPGTEVPHAFSGSMQFCGILWTTLSLQSDIFRIAK